MDRRFVSTEVAPVEIEERQGEPKKFVGYAARFYNGTPGTEYTLFEYDDDRSGKHKRIVERIDSKAFDRMMNDSDDVRLLFNHDPSLLLGRRSAGTLSLAVFPNKGLRYIGTAGDTTIARDLQEHIRRGDITGSSFSFSVTRNDEEWSTEGDELEVRTIKNFSRVFDVGPVTFPAYEATSAGMRQEEFIKEARASWDARTSRLVEIQNEIKALQQRALRVRSECTV